MTEKIKRYFKLNKILIISLLFIIVGFSISVRTYKKLEKKDYFLSYDERARIIMKDFRSQDAKFDKLFYYSADFNIPVIPPKVDKKVLNNRYIVNLELEVVYPMNQKSYNAIIHKFSPFSKEMLKVLKKNGVKKPEIELRVVDNDLSQSEESEKLHTSYIFK